MPSPPAPVYAATPTAATLRSWPEYGLNPQRSNATGASTGIDAANVRNLTRTQVALPGTVDSSPIYLHQALVGGAPHDVLIVTTTYGMTLAIDARTGAILWRFTPSAVGSWQGGPQVTTSSPVAAASGRFVFATSPDGLVHKLALADGREAPGRWPVSVTRDPGREKLDSALNLTGSLLLVSTGGYYGDAPPYQGHVVAIDAASGRIDAVFDTLCANRHAIIAPASCPASDSGIWARAGVVVEPGGRRVLLATGNGPYDGARNFGDSVLELTLPGLILRQSYTPPDQAQLNASDTDLGSSAPALLGGGLVLQGGKDGRLRTISIANGFGARRVGGDVQTLSTPGGAELYTTPAVWARSGHVSVYVADNAGTAAYAVRARRLYRLWSNASAGTSPVLAGGLLYVFDPGGGGIAVYDPASGRTIVRLAAGRGHWNSPIVVDGIVAQAEGSYMDHADHGVLDIYSPAVAR